MNKAFFLYQAPITPESGAVFCDKLEKCLSERCDEICLLLNSPGGSLRLALGILNFLETLPIRITTFNMSSCDSAAILLFLSGEKRFCTPESRFWTHPVYKESPITHDESDLEVELKCLRQDNEAVISAIASRTGGDPDTWRKAMLEKRFISAAEAQTLGLVHEIGHPRGDVSNKYHVIV